MLLKKLFFALLAAVASLSFASYAMANVFGYAWSENIGWIKFSGPNYGVSIDSNTGAFSGYAWSENIGWINMNGVGLNLSTNDVSGVARACAGAADPINCGGGVNPEAGGWDGYIKFSGPGYSVKRVALSDGSCYLSGWAWGSTNVGWIKFGGSNYNLMTTACSAVVPPPDGDGVIACDFFASPDKLIYPNRTAILNWSCQNAVSCDISGVGAVDSQAGSVSVDAPKTTTFTLSCNNQTNSFSSSVTVLVLKPFYCEIIPQGPGCE